MPYTPPSHSSPSCSAPSSPDTSRRSSFNLSTPQPRPALPKSTSYLTKHRRSSSTTAIATVPALNHESTSDITTFSTSDALNIMAGPHQSSVRQSPPPIANAQTIPSGAMISPPESSSEDEEIAEPINRVREIKNIKELKEAVSAIPQRRSGSPNRASHNDLLLPPSPVDHIDLLSKQSIEPTGFGLGRRISHSRSRTDGNIYFSMPSDALLSTSEESSEQDDSTRKPAMVRKKSGELVRPALRPASLRRPSSMPGTPTFTKAVHFDSNLEHVRHFLQVDKPLAVSTCSSPTDNYDSDMEDPFKLLDKSGVRPTSHEWEIMMNNFPAETPIRKCLPARLERMWMSPDQKSLIGSVSVANLAFQKTVICRFTFDYWKTTSEVVAEYQYEIRPRDTGIGHDRFQFSIKLSDIVSLETKTLLLCIRYNVNGLEYWDNNDSANFQVEFRIKSPAQNGKKGLHGTSSSSAGGLPRSSRRTNASARPRPSTAGASGEFEQKSISTNVGQPIRDFFDEKEPIGLRLKSSKSTTSLASDNLLSRLSAPSGAAFANRYDFGASLSAAKQAQRSSQPDECLYMKAHQRNTSNSSTSADASQTRSNVTRVDSSLGRQATGLPPCTASASSPGTASSSTSITSASYEEILNKYCFFNGSKQSSPVLNDGGLRKDQYDGNDESPTQNFTSSYCLGGSPSMADRMHHGAVQQNFTQNSNFHFYNAQYNAHMTTIGNSLSGSPRQVPEVSEKFNELSDTTVSAEAYLATPSMALNGSVPNRTQYHRIQRIQDRSPFISDAHSTTAISC